eukprot:UC4_evm9s805
MPTNDFIRGIVAGVVLTGGTMALWRLYLFYSLENGKDKNDELSKYPITNSDSLPTITLEEVQKHQWMVVSGKIYDVASYMKNGEHPGGSGLISKYIGRDATKAYIGQNHSPDANSILDSMLIGKISNQGDLSSLLNLSEIEERALSILDKNPAAYYSAGAEDNLSISENLRSWSDYQLRPRVFVDVTNVDLSTTVLGHKICIPIMAAPTALLQMAHDEGESGVARACGDMGVGNILSTTASQDIETVSAACPDCYRWFQLYVYRDKEKTKRLVERAEASGYSAICLTVDLPVLGNRTSLKRIDFKVPKAFKMANMVSEKETASDKSARATGVDIKEAGDRQSYVKKLYDQNLSLDLIQWLGSICNLPIVIKGILRGEDAVRVAAIPRVRAIIVSNHGGRQLDGTISPLQALPEILDKLQSVNYKRASQGLPEVEVIVDGGVRRGRDVFKALALGARAVLIGRPIIWGLATGGDRGAKRVFEILRDELTTCMQLSGCQNISQIDSSFIVKKTSI